MKKEFVFILLIAVVIVISGCAKEISDEELIAELSELSDEELNLVIKEAETGESKAVAGLAMRGISSRVAGVSKSRLTTAAKKVQAMKTDTLYALKVCGNNICDESETFNNCPQDCELPPLPEGECFDTDGEGEENYAEFGAVMIIGEEGISSDFCFSGQLKEYYCEGKEKKSKYIDCQTGEVCNNGACVKSEETFICGNRICENQREEDSGCSYDCGWGSCKGSYCPNNKVDVFCACQEDGFKIVKEISPCKAQLSCDNCDKQETLFDDFHDMQSQVYVCLANYFQFNPPRVPNLVVYDSLGEKCDDPNGCFGYETGNNQPVGLIWNPLSGSRNYGENQPTEPQQLTADKHETTHYFLNQMLHGLPGWLHEAVAIQTNERLNCHPQENPRGDGYLAETPLDVQYNGGILMNDQTKLNDNFYQRLKDGETSLSTNEKQNHYITGVLWILGLKLDYGCTEDCVRDIILKLKEHIDTQCQISQDDCGLFRFFVFETHKACPLEPEIPGPTGNIIADATKSSKIGISPPPALTTQKSSYKHPSSWIVWSGVEISNDIIKTATDEVTSQDTSALFDLLGIQY